MMRRLHRPPRFAPMRLPNNCEGGKRTLRRFVSMPCGVLHMLKEMSSFRHKDRSGGKPICLLLPHTLHQCAGKKFHSPPHAQRQIKLLKNHLLSIFPVHGQDTYVRLSCIALTEVTFSCANPFTCDSADALRSCLLTCFTESEVDDVIKLIDGGETVHRQLTDADARSLGFQPNIH